MTGQPDDAEDPDLEAVLPADSEVMRNTVVALFLVALVASAVPAFTPLPAGYLYAAGVLVVGWAAVYLVVYKRVQAGFSRQLATLRRLVAGVAAAFLVREVFRVFVAILSVDGIVPAGEANVVVWIAAIAAGIAAVVVADPERLVWFIATVFVLNIAIREIILATGTRLVVPDTATGLAIYFGLLIPTVSVAYLVVYRGIHRWPLDRFR
ncbi:MAG: hypothetical protein ABEJ57_04025 [Halobacteriaceae archaeon]